MRKDDYKAHAITEITMWDEFNRYDYARIFEEMLQPSFIIIKRELLAI
jgi:hypothetical protein